jgi:hypothetical protein
MQNLNKKIIILITILVIGCIFFIFMYLSSQLKLRNAEQVIASQQINGKVLLFSKLFFEKVLQGTKIVSFDDRLQLENSVRALNDKEIFDSWEKFTGAKDQTEVQQDFYDLFGLLLKKIKS